MRAAQVGSLKRQKTGVGGGVETTDDAAELEINSGSTVFGSVDAAGAVPEIGSSTVEGDVTAGGKIQLKIKISIKDSDLCTATDAGLETTDGGAVTVKSNSTAGGPVDADGRVEKTENPTVEGAVASNGDAKLEGSMTVESATIERRVDAGGDVLLRGSTTVTGDVVAEGSVTILRERDGQRDGHGEPVTARHARRRHLDRADRSAPPHGTDGRSSGARRRPVARRSGRVLPIPQYSYARAEYRR